MNDKTDAKRQRIGALEQLIVVLRKQNEGMRRSLADKDRRIEALELQVKALLSCTAEVLPVDANGLWVREGGGFVTAQNSETI